MLEMTLSSRIHEMRMGILWISDQNILKMTLSQAGSMRWGWVFYGCF
jgi:hypothetical protein